jgi:predicted component of type VI protein secretion system
MRDDDARSAEKVPFHSRLEVLAGPQKGEVFDLEHAPFRLGRDRACEVRLADPQSMMSGTHAVVEARDGRASIVDRSLNGTEIRRGPLGRREEMTNGSRLSLEDGDVIVLTPDIHVRFRIVAVPPTPDASTVDRREAARAAAFEETAAPTKPVKQTQAAPAKPERRKLLYVGVAMFWICVAVVLAAQSSPPATGAEDAAFLAAIERGDPTSAEVKEFAAKIGDNWNTLHDLWIEARVAEGRREAAAAARTWTRIQIWAIANQDVVGRPDAARIAGECARRIKALAE